MDMLEREEKHRLLKSFGFQCQHEFRYVVYQDEMGEEVQCRFDKIPNKMCFNHAMSAIFKAGIERGKTEKVNQFREILLID